MHDTIFLQTGQTHDPVPFLGIIFDNPILNNIDQTLIYTLNITMLLSIFK